MKDRIFKIGKEKIKILDTTLRDGEQTPGVSLPADSKALIAQKIDDLGVDIIEAGSAITSRGERKAIKSIAALGLNAEIMSYCRIRREDIDSALDCNVDSVHLVVPVSDLHIEQKLKKDRAGVLELTQEMTDYAVAHGLIVELSGEDASRADLGYLKAVYQAGIDAGAERLCFCDTVGVLAPETSYEVFRDLSELSIPVSVHCHNDFGMATANTLAALRGGGREAHVTINGIGERAGNASLEEVVTALEVLYSYRTSLDLKNLYAVSRLVSRLSGIPVAPNKALVGGNAFTHEAGIHVHGLLANTATYEPITPEFVGRERRIVFGKHAGRSSVLLALKELGLAADDKQIDDIVGRMKDLGDRGKRVTDADLQAITETVLGISQEAQVKLEELTVVAGNTVMPTASIRLKVNGRHVVEAGVGTGPVDAAFNAIKKGVSGVMDINLDEYHVDAITGGTDALVEVWVKLSKGNQAITARGARTDIVMASVEAMIEAINRLILKENKKR